MRGRRRERGHLMLWAAVFGVVAMAYWALAFRATGDCIRVERASLLRAKRDDGPARALAAGIALLRTGVPPSSPWECVVTPEDGTPCVVTISEGFGTGEWEVEARPATEDDVSSLGAAPPSF